MSYTAASPFEHDGSSPPPVPLIAAAGWLVPGLGYALIGERKRAIFCGSAILALFVLGILIAGVRCVDVPGYDANGALKRVGPRSSELLISASPFRSIMDRPWYIPQILAGPVTIGASIWSVSVSDDYPKSTARLWDIGTLYTAVAGMLNLLVMMDCAHRAAKIREANPRLGPM